MKFHLKKRKIIFETLFSPSFDVPHSSPIVYMDHTELIFQDLLLHCTNKVAKNHNKFFHFCHGSETHFLVLAQNLIFTNTNVKEQKNISQCQHPQRSFEVSFVSSGMEKKVEVFLFLPKWLEGKFLACHLENLKNKTFF